MIKFLIWVVLFALGFFAVTIFPAQNYSVAPAKDAPSDLTLTLPFNESSHWSDFSIRDSRFVARPGDTWFAYGWFGAIKSTQETGGTQYPTFGNRHSGIDFAGREGLEVVAAAPGQVYFVGDLYGNTVMIRHKDGYRTVYGHLQEIRVAPEERVDRGQVIGLLGRSGTVNPHLHFEVKRRVGNEVWAINPRKLLKVDWNQVVIPDLPANEFYEGDPGNPDGQADFLWPKFPL